jgi:hypothetical protein
MQLLLVILQADTINAPKQLLLDTKQPNAARVAMQSQLVLTLVSITNAVVQWPLVNMQDKDVAVAPVVLKVVTP